MLKNKKQLWGLIALSLIMFIVTLDTTITNIALPDITTYFKTDLIETNWISTIYVLVMAVAIIPAAKFGDQFGRKKLMLIGLLIFGIGSMLCGFSKNLPMLIGMRFIQGIGGAIVTPIMIPLSVELFGRQKANQAVGIIGAVTAVAAAAGPPIGGILLKYVSWSWIFFINLPIVVLTVILVAWCFEESVDATISKRIDFLGLVFLTLSLSQLALVLVKGYDFGWQSKLSLALISGAILTFSLFILAERWVSSPLVELNLFKELTFSFSTLIYFICGFTIVCSSLVFNFYLENVRGDSALAAAFIIMFMSITVMLSMPLGSWLAQSIGFRPVISFGMLLMTLGLWLLTTLQPQTTEQTMIIFMVILGFGFGFACLSLVSAVQFISEEKAGIASGIVNAARQLGTCLGIALLVGAMTHHVDTAKNNIKQDSVIQLTKKQLQTNLSKLIIQQIDLSLTETNNRQHFTATFKKKLMTEITQKQAASQPQNVQLKQLYLGLASLRTQFTNQPNTVATLASQINSVQKQLMVQDKALTKNDTNQVKLLTTQSELALLLSKKGNIHQGLTKAMVGLSQIDISIRLKSLLKQLQINKNQQLTTAFTDTFSLATWIVGLFSIAAWFTERKRE